MMIFGIIGRPLGHSRSKAWFEEKFAAEGLDDCRFCNFPLENIDELGGLLERHRGELRGFCVTIPYKQAVMTRLDSISPEARQIGAVNCVSVREDGLHGYNTDAAGFRAGLEQLLGGARPERALVLGTGGASRAVRYVLESAGIEYRMVSRTAGHDTVGNAPKTLSNDPQPLTYDDLTPAIIDAHRLIINTTPLGTFPAIDGRPDLPYEAIGAGHYLYDLVYNPLLTAFLAEGRQRGAATIGGRTMFETQAENNWTIWNRPR
ncbi:MAG: shikimate dehydrogenase [Alistipes sp.]|jgi:shikimate dehydrogenase|nr:shikimate dehydrogenase [Alistipes sp.]